MKTDTKKKMMRTQIMAQTILKRSYSLNGVDFIKPTTPRNKKESRLSLTHTGDSLNDSLFGGQSKNGIDLRDPFHFFAYIRQIA